MDGTHYLPPTIILNRKFLAEDGSSQNLKIGIIGFVTPQIVEWDKAHLTSRITTMDIVDAATAHIPALHAGGPPHRAQPFRHFHRPPARRRGKHLLLPRLRPRDRHHLHWHSHRVFPGPDYAGINDTDATRGTLGNIPAAMPGFWGSELGIIDLTLTQQAGRWTISNFTRATQPISERADAAVTSLAANDPRIDNAIAPEHHKPWPGFASPSGISPAR